MTNGADTIGIQQVARLLTARTGMDLRGARGRWLRDYLRACPGDETRWTPDHLESDQGAFNRLVDRVTVQESYFFREPTVLETVRERVFPTLREGSGPVRAWSAGCAGGEEARTLGMMLFDAGLADRAHVLGTDLASVAVRSARSGVYGRWSLRGVDARTVAARFRPVGDKFAVLQARCAEVGFAEHNLLDAAPPAGAPFDLILCRNVLIYLTPSAVGHVARLLAGSLRPGGWLVTGISDPALGEIDGLELSQSSRGAIYRRVPHEPPGPGRSTPRPARRQSEPVNGRRRRSTEVPHRAARVPALSGDLPDRWVSSAEHALDDGRPGDAERIARRALTVGSQPTLAHALLIRALAADGRGMDAMDAAEQAVRELPDEGSLRGLQAAALLDAGRVDEARRAARQSLYLDPAEALAHIVLARAAELLGDEVTARRARRNGHRVMRSHAR